MTAISKETIDVIWLVICAGLVFIMQAGFCCLESGLVRSKNSINIALKNLIDFCVSFLLFWALGFGIMFGVSQSGIFGNPTHSHFNHLSPQVAAFFLFQAMFCGAATTIVSGAVAERIHFRAYLLIAVVTSALVYPLVGHWVWGGVMQGVPSGWLAKMGFVDFAGSTVVHLTGGMMALAALLIIGPRLGRFDHDSPPIQSSNLPLAMLGVLILWFGWIGFNGGSTFGNYDRLPSILMNTCLAGASGAVTSLVMSSMILRRADVVMVMNGVIAGMVSITASCHIVAHADAVAIGSVGGVLCFVVTRWLERMRIDDAIGAVPAHGAAGVWGTLSVALFATAAETGTGLGRWEQLGVQALGVLACGGWTFGVGIGAIALFNRVSTLRVSQQEEREGLNISEHGTSTALIDLMLEMEDHRETGDFSKTVHEEPHTEVGQIARQYNRILTRVNSEIINQRKMTQLFEASEQRQRTILESANDAFLSFDCQLNVIDWSLRAEEVFGWSKKDILGRCLHSTLFSGNSRSLLQNAVSLATSTMKGQRFKTVAHSRSERKFLIELSMSPMKDGATMIFNAFVKDLSDRSAIQLQLAQAQRLESFGQLAAGLAQEINTPTQFVGENTRFIQEVFAQIDELINKIVDAQHQEEASDQLMGELQELIQDSQLEQLVEQIPGAIRQSLDGVDQVTQIIRAMKNFSQSADEEKKAIDINEAIRTTAMVARNRWKSVANLQLDLEPDLPMIAGYASDLNQVLLNFIMNAAHAIKQLRGERSDHRGRIDIKTWREDREAVITIRDTGCGMAEQIQQRMYDPFFTTKDAGDGTGQGLAIARAVVMEKHGGSIECRSVPGEGTQFTIRLPLDVDEQSDMAEVASELQHAT